MKITFEDLKDVYGDKAQEISEAIISYIEDELTRYGSLKIVANALEDLQNSSFSHVEPCLSQKLGLYGDDGDYDSGTAHVVQSIFNIMSDLLEEKILDLINEELIPQVGTMVDVVFEDMVDSAEDWFEHNGEW